MVSRKKKKERERIILYSALAFIIGLVVLFFLNNFTTKEVYKGVSCTFNKHECNNQTAWDGECTDEIEDECCDYVSIRWCQGEVDNPTDCLDKYCMNEGKTCDAIYDVAGVWKCTCVDTNDQLEVC